MKLFVFCVTFVVFTIEALIHFIAGKHSGLSYEQNQKWIKKIPNLKELLGIVSVVAFFSIINAHIIGSYK